RTSLEGIEGVCAVAGWAVLPHLGLSDRVALEVWTEALALAAEPDSFAPAPWRRTELRRHRLCDEVRYSWTAGSNDVQGSLDGWLTDVRGASNSWPWSRFEAARDFCSERMLNAHYWTREASRATLFGWGAETPDEIGQALTAL